MNSNSVPVFTGGTGTIQSKLTSLNDIWAKLGDPQSIEVILERAYGALPAGTRVKAEKRTFSIVNFYHVDCPLGSLVLVGDEPLFGAVMGWQTQHQLTLPPSISININDLFIESDQIVAHRCGTCGAHTQRIQLFSSTVDHCEPCAVSKSSMFKTPS